jgi:hypothetical protein
MEAALSITIVMTTDCSRSCWWHFGDGRDLHHRYERLSSPAEFPEAIHLPGSRSFGFILATFRANREKIGGLHANGIAGPTQE